MLGARLLSSAKIKRPAGLCDLTGRSSTKFWWRLEGELQGVLNLAEAVLKNGVDLAVTAGSRCRRQDLSGGRNVSNRITSRIAVDRVLEIDARVQDVVRIVVRRVERIE